jgi:hypothetical protein
MSRGEARGEERTASNHRRTAAADKGVMQCTWVVAACAVRGGREAGDARRSDSWRGRDAALAVGVSAGSKRRPGARSGNWSGGPAQSKSVWPQAGFKMELDCTDQWAGPDKSFSIFKVSSNCI